MRPPPALPPAIAPLPPAPPFAFKRPSPVTVVACRIMLPPAPPPHAYSPLTPGKPLAVIVPSTNILALACNMIAPPPTPPPSPFLHDPPPPLPKDRGVSDDPYALLPAGFESTSNFTPKPPYPAPLPGCFLPPESPRPG